mmetsp:Transcript_46824/g.130388  ORF Transcript_46824/g.130388 Transcript_46824/m.130388 type:complete len:216 (-) Transcript_46824:452-1099(-)
MPLSFRTSGPSSNVRSPSNTFVTAQPVRQRLVSSWEQCPKTPTSGTHASSMSVRMTSIPRVKTSEPTKDIIGHGEIPRPSSPASHSLSAPALENSRFAASDLLRTSHHKYLEAGAAAWRIRAITQASRSLSFTCVNRSASRASQQALWTSSFLSGTASGRVCAAAGDRGVEEPEVVVPVSPSESVPTSVDAADGDLGNALQSPSPDSPQRSSRTM